MTNFTDAVALHDESAQHYLLEAQRMRAAHFRALISRLFARIRKSDTTTTGVAPPAAA